MNNWMDYAKAAGELAATLTKQYGPEAWETILWIQRVEAIQKLTFPIFVLVALFFVVKPLCLKGWKYTETFDYTQDTTFARVGGSILLSISVGPVAVYSIVCVFQIWAWVQLFKPDLYLAKLLIDKVIN